MTKKKIADIKGNARRKTKTLVNPRGDRMGTPKNLFIRIIETLDALGLQVVAIKDGPSLVIKVVDKEPPRQTAGN
jgi:hypothetical protein